MTPSIDELRYRKIIFSLCDTLHDDYMGALIDIPIDYAVEQYYFPNKPIDSYTGFIEEFSKFIRHLKAQGQNVKQYLSDIQAESEAFTLLNEYQGLHGNGVAAAWMDVKYQYNGDIQPVLMQLKDVIKQNQRKQHTQWRLTNELTRLDWVGKCRLVETLIELLKDDLPEIVLECEPEQLVYQIPSLIQMHINSSIQIQKIFSNAKKFTPS